ncbi:MAG: hypothetical protein ACXACF_07730 [Candidatus Hermodarchaeia archaeon]|jgi:replication factor A1
MSYDREPVEATVAELRPFMKSLNITIKITEKGEEREVTSRRDGETHRVVDAIAGDATGTVLISLWDDMIETVEVDKTYRLEKGYTSLFQGHLRLNIGRYGEISEPNTNNPAIAVEATAGDAEAADIDVTVDIAAIETEIEVGADTNSQQKPTPFLHVNYSWREGIFSFPVVILSILKVSKLN